MGQVARTGWWFEWLQGPGVSVLVAAFGVAIASLMWACNEHNDRTGPERMGRGIDLVDARATYTRTIPVEPPRVEP